MDTDSSLEIFGKDEPYVGAFNANGFEVVEFVVAVSVTDWRPSSSVSYSERGSFPLLKLGLDILEKFFISLTRTWKSNRTDCLTRNPSTPLPP
jgi:hypothetical protein